MYVLLRCLLEHSSTRARCSRCFMIGASMSDDDDEVETETDETSWCG
jgi:hypothetical protein